MAGRWIETWEPENETFWRESGERVARRNLWFSVLSEHMGSLIRPVGGRLADRHGGARITLATFAAMGAATSVVIYASASASLPVFLVGFTALFVLTGLGNGSTYKMIPGIFHTQALEKGLDGEAAAAHGRRLSGAAMGFIGAVGALGGLAINLAFRQSFQTSGTGTAAF